MVFTGIEPGGSGNWPQQDAAIADFTGQGTALERQPSQRVTAADTAYELIIAAGISETDLEDQEEPQPAVAPPAAEFGTLEEDLQLPHEAVKVLRKLAEKREDIQDARGFRLQAVKGALTNRVFECHWAREHVGKMPKKVLVRVYGTGSNLFFNREDEVATFEQMSARQQGPLLLARFPNGRVEEFLHARTLTAEDLRDPDISARIAAKLSEFHKLDIAGPKEPKLWSRLSNWLQTALDLATSEQICRFGVETLEKEIADLKLQLDNLGGAVGFCHNDLQYGNIMMSEKDKSVTLIDYEYSSYNPVAYDIANHFCEMTANYHTDTPHVLDFSKYPDVVERHRFILNYLQTSLGPVENLCLGLVTRAPGSFVSPSQVESLAEEVECYTLVSHITWALWGIISCNLSDIDFDFEEYGWQRLERYRASKTQILGSGGGRPKN